MTGQRNGPPIEDGAPKGPTNLEGLPHPTTNTTENNGFAGRRTFKRPATPQPLPRVCPTDIPGQLRARCAASHRCEPLGESGNIRDPWVPWRPEKLPENQIDAGRDAARFILDAGYVPLLELEVLRALYRRGGADRVLAEQLHELTGGVAA